MRTRQTCLHGGFLLLGLASLACPAEPRREGPILVDASRATATEAPSAASRPDAGANVPTREVSSPAVELALTMNTACARRADGSVFCWGGGPVGDGTEEDRSVPVRVSGIGDAIRIAGRWQHFCALRADRSVSCWGKVDQRARATGPGPLPVGVTPIPVPELHDAIAIATGRYFGCAIRSGGDVACWEVLLADPPPYGPSPDALPIGGNSLSPVPVAGLRDAVEIAAGDIFACVRHRGGKVSCWGYAGDGMLGDGRSPVPDSPGHRLTPGPVVGISDAVEIAAGDAHACARRVNGTVMCWGSDEYYQLGAGDQVREGCPGRRCSARPLRVHGLIDAVQIAAGSEASCARRVGGGLVCWGRDDQGQLGDRTTGAGDWNTRPEPRAVVDLNDAAEVRIAKDFACARRRTGAVVCWGSNAAGALGDGLEHRDAGANTSLVPVEVRLP
jgi:alpha-tubulin suppressor-like RCC1 family protein